MKTNRKKAFLFLLMLLSFLSFTTTGQTIVRQSIGSYGASGSIQGAHISQTIGQPYATGIYADAVVGVSPGFQQSGLWLSQSNDRERPTEKSFGDRDQQNIKVYPNPASHHLYIDARIEQGEVTIFDMQGKTILGTQISDPYAHRIDCSDWKSGIYMIKVYDPSTSTSTKTKVLISK
jgi:hypothetical protein